MSDSANPKSQLEETAAYARLFVVAFIQTVGVYLAIALIEYGPRAFKIGETADWQHDCLLIGKALQMSVVVLWLTFGCSWFWKWRASIPEFVIMIVFGLNIIAFSLAMARTGGPSQSFFGQLLPMQLSGILLLEHQKAALLKTKRTAPWGYAGYAVAWWLIASVFHSAVAGLFGREQMTVEASFACYEKVAASILFALGIGVTAFAYVITDRPGFVARFQRPD